MTYDPSLRVLTVLELLQAREEVTGAELARRLEVSPRTVQRYVTRLQDLGIPVEGRRGVGGAYRLKPGFRLPPLMFTGEEALSLALGLLALQLLGLGQLAPAAGAASAKLMRTLPNPLRESVQALEHVVQLDQTPWVISTDVAMLSTLLAAVRQGRGIRLAYTDDRGQVSSRQVEVYRVVHLDGRWYAVGRCLLRDALRSFRLDRIQELAVLDTSFTPQPSFNALGFLRGTLPTPPCGYEVSVWLDAPPHELRGRVSLWQTEVREENGGTRLECQRDRLSSYAAFLLSLGVEFRIDSPPELKQEFAILAERCRKVAQARGQSN